MFFLQAVSDDVAFAEGFGKGRGVVFKRYEDEFLGKALQRGR